MRKTLEAISLAVLVFQGWITFCALHGPHRLPQSIPIHFDGAGHADDWGSPATLLILSVITVAFYLLFTLLRTRLLEASSSPVEVTEENSARLEELNRDQLAWIKMEVVCLFAGIQWDSIASARQQELSVPVLAQILVPVVVLLATVAWFNVAMRWAGRSAARG
jgi:uncharacterized membrane protein